MERSLVEPFRWRDRHGIFHKPRDMDTSYLFNTLKMIWNHCAPENMQIKPFRQYIFSPFYTPKYMTEAVRALSLELARRKDIQPDQLNTLRGMCTISHTKATQLLTTDT